MFVRALRFLVEPCTVHVVGVIWRSPIIAAIKPVLVFGIGNAF